MEFNHVSEQKFAAYLEEKNESYIYRPRFSMFYQLGYTPDFYVLGKGFFEVVGTRQAFSQNRLKITEAQKIAEVRIVRPDGSPFNSQDIRKTDAKTRVPIRYRRNRPAKETLLFTSFLVNSFLTDNKMFCNELARILEVTTPTIINHIRNDRIRTAQVEILKNKGYEVEKYKINCRKEAI